ncbi:MAG: hypothetical protein RIQ93_395 [Verrucomicrobiota bacterium]
MDLLSTMNLSLNSRLFSGAAALLVLALGGCSREAPESKSAPDAKAKADAATAPAAVAPRRASFKFASQTLSVPEGFTVELVAGPPLVNRPISLAFDSSGALYATDSSGLSERADKQAELKPHRVVRLEDADGDGRMEKGTVFAENMMFPQGAMFYEGSLYVGAPPEIWKLTDTNGDGISDQRSAWFNGKTLTGCANDLHGPYLGPDGWFYWTKGASAEQQHALGNGRPFLTRAAHIFRSRPDGSGLEPVLTGGMDNPVGVAFTATGERILSGTFFQVGVAGKRDGLIHSIYGGVYGKDQPSIVGHVRTGDLMPIMTHMGAAAPCGSITYLSRQFGAEYEGNVFVCYFNLRKVVRHELVADGATFQTRDMDFITSDSADFRPTDVLEDADGSLLVADTGGWYKICCPTSQLAKPEVLGAIYRIRKTGAPKIEDPRGRKLPWSTLSGDVLIALLDDPRPDVQQRAIHQLGRMGEPVVSALSVTATKAASAATRRNAVWALARIDAPAAREAGRRALSDRDASVVQSALHSVSLWRDAKALDALLRFVAGDQPALVRRAAEALGRLGEPQAVGPLLAAAGRLSGAARVTLSGTPENPAERILEHALIYALIEIGRRDAIVTQLKSAANPRVIRAALVALDQMENGGLQAADVIGSLEAPLPVLKSTAGWVAAHHPEWGGELANFFRRRLANGLGDEAERAELERQLAQLAKAPAIQELLADTVSNPGASVDARLLSLRVMAAAGLKETPPRWLSDLATLLSSNALDPALARQGVISAAAWPQAKERAELAAALVRLGRNAAAPDDARVDALALVPASLTSVEPELFAFLRAHLDSAQPMLVRSAAANALAKVSLTPAQQLALADTMKTVGALEVPKLLPAFSRASNDELGLKLVGSLKQSRGLAGLRADALKPFFAKYSPAVQQAGGELLGMLNADAARQNARVDELLANAKNGDIRRGQAVFNSEKTACSMCHVIGYLGGRLGPDLTSIGRIRNERELLEAIVFPSATFVRGYEPFVATTKAGETHSGIMRKDTSEEVVLATGPATEQRIARAEITDLQPGVVSSMPPGLDAVLTPQELADLLAFLKSRGI